jgi:DNA polymerase-3 subunit alpha
MVPAASFEWTTPTGKALRLSIEPGKVGEELTAGADGSNPAPGTILGLVHTEQGDLDQGLGVRLQLRRADAMADLDLGDQARFWPCDEALARWRSVAHGGQASIVYG